MNKYALCIGINDYPGNGNDLAGCVNDAHDWAAALKRRGFKIKMLLNRAATGRRMRDEIAALLGRARAPPDGPVPAAADLLVGAPGGGDGPRGGGGGPRGGGDETPVPRCGRA